MVLMRALPDRNPRTGFKWLWLSALVIVLDQLTKWWFVTNLSLHERVPVIPNLFDWTLAYNKGVAFSMFNQGLAWQRYGLAFFALTVAIVFAIWMSRLPRHEKASAIALSLVVGGALGNVIDRFRLGHVVDFILVYWQDWSWPAFNVADSAICIGAALLVYAGFRSKPAAIA